jgi:SAM-dependent methyltransferase
VSVASFLKRQRHRFTVDLKDRRSYWSFSAIVWAGHECLAQLAPRYIRGRTLDIGAGAQNSRAIILQHASAYVSLDIQDSTGTLDILNDVQNMKDVPDASVDTAYSSGALGYAHDPAAAMREVYRVIKPDGHVIMIAPFLNGIVDEPDHLFHFTPHGLRHLVESAGFDVVEERRIGGILSFLSHNVSYVLVSACWPVPLLRWIMWMANKLILVHLPLWLDHAFRLNNRFPVMVVAVGRKNERQ